MAANKMRPIHPGEILREEYLIPLELSVNALAQALRIPSTLINPAILSIALLFTAKLYGADYSLPSPDKHQLQPIANLKKLDSAYLKLPNRTDIQGGYLIGTDGINYPAIQQTGLTTLTWLFPNDLKTLFTRQENLMVNDFEGRVYRLSQSDWILTDIKLKPRSRVLLAADDIIACTEPSPAKANAVQAECYALNAGWTLPYSTVPKPEICNGKLRIATKNKKKVTVSEIDLKNGAKLKSTEMKKPADLICKAQIK
ncbi:MAG TPA: hypothetical protein VIZ65_09435 [Cellvibrionaceae bacterium]